MPASSARPHLPTPHPRSPACSTPRSSTPSARRVWRSWSPAGARVLVIVSDATRAEPRGPLVRAVLARLPGTARHHASRSRPAPTARRRSTSSRRPGPADRARVTGWSTTTGRPATSSSRSGTRDAARPSRSTARSSTPTWSSRPAASSRTTSPASAPACKAIFPGLGGAREVRINHRLKTRAGRARRRGRRQSVSRGPRGGRRACCQRPTFLLNAVLDDDGAARAAVAGDVRAAFRAGAAAVRAALPRATPPAPLRDRVRPRPGHRERSTRPRSSSPPPRRSSRRAAPSSSSPSAARAPARSTSSTAASTRSASSRACHRITASSSSRRCRATKWSRPIASGHRRSRLPSKPSTPTSHRR